MSERQTLKSTNERIDEFEKELKRVDIFASGNGDAIKENSDAVKLLRKEIDERFNRLQSTLNLLIEGHYKNSAFRQANEKWWWQFWK